MSLEDFIEKFNEFKGKGNSKPLILLYDCV